MPRSVEKHSGRGSLRMREGAMDERERSFDLDWYVKHLDKLLDFSWDEYKQVTFERHRIQHAILRNYLWLATAIFSAECVGFSQIFDGVVWFGLPLNANSVFNVFAFLSVACAFVTMALGINTMRGRDVAMPYYGWNAVHFSVEAWKEANGELDKPTVHLELLKHLDKAISHNRESTMRKALRLRCMSFGLLASLGFGLCALTSAIIF